MLQSAVIQGNTLEAASYTGVDQRSEFNTEADSTNFYQAVLHGSYQVTDSSRSGAWSATPSPTTNCPTSTRCS